MPSFIVEKRLGQAEVYEVETLRVPMTNKDVLQLEIVVNVAALVQLLQSLDLENLIDHRLLFK